MVSNPTVALATAAAALFAVAVPASACRLTAVPGWTDGTSVVRLEMRGRRTCTIGHYTVVQGRHGLRAIRTSDFALDRRPNRGAVTFRSNRTVYRGPAGVRFAYDVTDRVGFDYDVKVRVVR